MLLLQQILAQLIAGVPITGTSTVGIQPDCTGQEQTIVATLSATPWTALSPRLSVPDYATRAVITAPAGLTMYRLNGDPAGNPDGTLKAGATLGISEMRVVGLAAGTSRTLGLSSAVASGQVRVEWLP